jgi:D-threonate/D-erythronate kinase
MALSIGVVADDLTGAADTGVAFLASGRSAVVTWPDGLSDSVIPAADVLAIDTGSRAMDVAPAREVTRQTVAYLRQRGARTLYKKIDSTLRGHLEDEVIAAMEAWHPHALAVVAPAFPALGRTTVDGQQRAHDAILTRVPALPAIFRAAGCAVHHAGLSIVRDRGALLALLLQARRTPRGVAVCDAVTDRDLVAIATAGAHVEEGVVWVGSGGLARAIAATLGPQASETVPPAAGPGGIVVVVGSMTDVARTQAARVVAAGAAPVVVPAATLRDADQGGAAAVRTAMAVQLSEGRDLVVTIGPGTDGGPADDLRLTERLGAMLRGCAVPIAGLVLTGGDTAVGVLKAWRTTGLRLVGEVEPGLVCAEMLGEKMMPVVTKAGAFGGPDALVRAVEHLRRLRGAGVGGTE